MNNDLISRKDAKYLVKQTAKQIAAQNGTVDEITYALKIVYDDIDGIPTIDAVPVRLRVEKADIVESNGWYRKRFYCPCGQLIRTEEWDEKRCFGEGTILKGNVMPRFCPNCGAKMDLEVQESIADYIECCNGPECYFDGKDTSLCIPCKVRWLKEKWEG